MYQVETIVTAVQLALDAKESTAVPAVMKHYLMDDHYVSREVRQDVLKAVNNHFDTKYSVTTIKKGNPALLKTLPFQLPEKEQLLAVDSLHGKAELPADGLTIISTKPNTAQEENTAMQNAEQNNGQQTTNAAAGAQPDQVANNKPAQPKKVKRVNEDDQDNGSSISKAQVKTFSEAYVNAVVENKGKVKKTHRHIDLTLTPDEFGKLPAKAVYTFLKPAVKFLVDALKVIKGMDDVGARETVFTAWVESDADRTKAFKKFSKWAKEDIKKADNIMALFILTSENNLKTAVDFNLFANENNDMKNKTDNNTFAFIRENDAGVNPRWAAGLSALVAGGVDMALSGVSVGSAVGTVAGTVGAFFAGGLLDDHIEDTALRCFAAGALGGAMGTLGARAGRHFISSGDETLLENSDSTVVATIPAQQVITKVQPVEEQSSGGFLNGITSYLMG